jgi:hypothetical protein
VVSSGHIWLGNEVHCIQQQMHEFDPLPSPIPAKCSKGTFSLGVMCTSLGLGAAPSHWHWVKPGGTWQAPRQRRRTRPNTVIQIIMKVSNHSKGGSLSLPGCEGNPSSRCGPCRGIFPKKFKESTTCSHAFKQAAHKQRFQRMHVLRARVACLGLEVGEHVSKGQICSWPQACQCCSVLHPAVVHH